MRFRSDGTMPAKRFFDTLCKGDQAFFLARFQRLASVSESKMNNDGVFKHERQNIWCFKRTTKCSPKGGKARFGLRVSERETGGLLHTAFGSP